MGDYWQSGEWIAFAYIFSIAGSLIFVVYS